ncbi:hypothetical protein KCU86_g61, partial [Aureobasidium melanogenum]
LPNDWASTLLLRASLSSFCRSSGSPAPAAAWVSSLACFSSSRALLAAFEDSCRHSASLGVLSEGLDASLPATFGTEAMTRPR